MMELLYITVLLAVGAREAGVGRAAAVVSRLRRRSSIAALGLRRVGAAAPVLHRILRAVAAPAVPLPAVAAAAAAVAPLARDVVAEAAHLAAVAQPLLEVEADAAPVGVSGGGGERGASGVASGSRVG